MATTAEHIAARVDPDLRQRLEATAEMHGVRDAALWVEENLGALLTAQVASEQTIVDVYAYAAGEHKRLLAEVTPRPGANLAAVTDSHLSAAVAAVVAS